MTKLMIVAAVVVTAFASPNLIGGQNGYYAIVGNSDREVSPTFPRQPWPDAFCRHDSVAAVSVCERGL